MFGVLPCIHCGVSSIGDGCMYAAPATANTAPLLRAGPGANAAHKDSKGSKVLGFRAGPGAEATHKESKGSRVLGFRAGPGAEATHKKSKQGLQDPVAGPWMQGVGIELHF